MTFDSLSLNEQAALPDLSGEWEMKIQWTRGDTTGEVNASATIKQASNSISMVVRSPGSDSHAIFCQVSHDNANDLVLHYIYAVEPKVTGTDAQGAYKGAAILRLFHDDEEELSGNYWTDQLTKGHFTLHRKLFGKSKLVEKVDVLLLTAIPVEYEAAKTVFSLASSSEGVQEWEERQEGNTHYIIGTYTNSENKLFRIAIAKSSRMGSTFISNLAATLIERLSPECLVMCGVCAGNPSEVALGDIVISEFAYQYDEGKLDVDGFVGSHRQSHVTTSWVAAAKLLKGEELPSYGQPSEADARYWLLERLNAGDNPKNHPARDRYFDGEMWRRVIEGLEKDGYLTITASYLSLTQKGKQEIERSVLLDIEPPKQLPLAVKVGPIASGNVVVKDGVTWDKLKQLGVRDVIGLEMEAAAIGAAAKEGGVPNWLVIKGVMDHADPRKDDRFKPFAARASAEALRMFLSQNISSFARDLGTR